MPISFVPEVIFHLGPLAVTNSLLTSWIVVAIIVILAIVGGRRLKIQPKGFQNLIELIIEKLYHMVEGVAESRKLTRLFFPLVASFFLYIIIANWMEVLPGFGTIGWAVAGTTEVVPFFRAASADLNFTIVLAVISVLTIQTIGIASLGFFKYAKRFLNFGGPIKFVVGILELVGEVAKLLSFSFRLFGNIFAGEVLLVVMTFLIPYLIPMPFLALEIFVGFIQALVFSMLTLVFLKMATVEAH
jgi:F-type H+-transporting ATPase subunit a